MRNALATAANGDVINCSVTGTITLTSRELLVTNSLAIIGPGPDLLAVSGNHHSRVFHIGPSNVVSISSLAITNGFKIESGGGGIYNDHATLTVSNCTLSGNSGSGIVNNGSGGNAGLVVVDCILSGNRGNGAGGGIFNNAESGTASVKILNSTLAGNSAANGGGICNGVFRGPRGGSASMEVINSSVIGNSVYAYGGGIFNDGRTVSATLTVVNSIVSSNSTTAYFGSGGGIWNDGSAAFSNSTLSGNSVGFLGGGIGNGGTMQIAGTTVSGNTSYEVGGIFNLGAMQISDSTISSNSALGVGGIWNRNVMQIVNSTLSGNSTAYSGGAIGNDGILLIAHCTISGNSAMVGGGIAGSATLENTILNAGATGGNIENSSFFSGTVTSLGYNLSSDDGGGFLTATGDQINADPMLGPLQDNGGPTFTHALLCGSPAIDAGDPNFSPPPDFDQRGPGFPRVVGGGIDIGAFEIQQGVCGVPAEQIKDLISLVQGLGLPSGPANSLNVKLQAAVSALGRENIQAACGNLGAFLNEVNAQKGKKFTAPQADALIAEATRIRAVVECQ